MPSLKEVKTRIASVNSTRKITSAMKMVASSKLHRAQQNIENMHPYESRLDEMTKSFVSALDGGVSSPYAVQREVKNVAILVFTSNSSLCGGFNSNVIKAMRQQVKAYKDQGIQVKYIIPVGKKGWDAAKKLGFTDSPAFHTLCEHPSYSGSLDISHKLMDDFLKGEIDKVDIIYHHFKSSASQVLTQETFLPIEIKPANSRSANIPNYIIEPSIEAVLEKLIPKTLCLKVYTSLLDSIASEHAARVIAMQIATDNADELLQELTLTYNKTRQQAITTELLDIVGGSMQ